MTSMLGGATRGEIYRIVERHRRELLQLERGAASEMVRAYGGIWQRLQRELNSLLEEYNAALEANGEISPSWVYEHDRLHNLQRQVEAELRRFADYAEARIVANEHEAIQAASRHLQEILTVSTAQPGIAARWDRLPTSAVEDLVGFTANGSPLRVLLDELGPAASEAVRSGLVEGLALGQNPRAIARRIRQDFGGELTRALRISRTETLRAYREATRRNYQANSDIIAGWRWLSAKQPRTCAMCLAMDGTFHTLDEHLDDHPNGRCAMVPCLKGDENAPPGWEMGSAWLDKQPADVQRQVLGNAGYEAYKAGVVKLSDFVGQKSDPRWGTTRYARSLTDILGADEAKRWRARPQQPPSPGSGRAVVPSATTQSSDLSQAEQTARQIEDRIRLNPSESLHGVDDQGQEVFTKAGGQYEVVLTNQEVAQLRGLVVTHNHPRGLVYPDTDPRHMGNSFSPEDVALSCAAEVAEVRAVTAELRYTLRPPAGGWDAQYWVGTLEPCYTRHARDVRIELWGAVITGDMPEENAEALHFHTIWRRVAQELGLDYRVDYG